MFVYQLDAEVQSLALQDLWNSGAADGHSNFALHAPQSNHLDCEPGPVLQIGYSPSLADQIGNIMLKREQKINKKGLLKQA